MPQQIRSIALLIIFLVSCGGATEKKKEEKLDSRDKIRLKQYQIQILFQKFYPPDMAIRSV